MTIFTINNSYLLKLMIIENALVTQIYMYEIYKFEWSHISKNDNIVRFLVIKIIQSNQLNFQVLFNTQLPSKCIFRNFIILNLNKNKNKNSKDSILVLNELK